MPDFSLLDEVRPPAPYGFVILSSTGQQIRVATRTDWLHAKELLDWESWSRPLIDVDGKTCVRYMCMSIDDAEDSSKPIGEHSTRELRSYILRRYLATGQEFALSEIAAESQHSEAFVRQAILPVCSAVSIDVAGVVRYYPATPEFREFLLGIIETFTKLKK